ncbi:hypothetical protein QTP88_018493 [Uroleucon formosanum]
MSESLPYVILFVVFILIAFAIIKKSVLYCDITLKKTKQKCLYVSDKHLKNATSFASYTSPNVQNEIITICGNLIQENILKNIRNAKYFSILVDETQDVSRLEQMSFCVRYVDGVSNCIMEDFLEFSIVHDMTGKVLSTSILQLLEKFGLEKKVINNIFPSFIAKEQKH